MNFGQAIEALKYGERVTRLGWNDKRTFLYYVPGGVYNPCMKNEANLVNGFGYDYGTVEYKGYIAMKTAQSKAVLWLASQTDMLAEDWAIADYKRIANTIDDEALDKTAGVPHKTVNIRRK